MPAGRPTKRTDAARDIILIKLAQCPILEIACNAAGISLKTAQRWMKDDQEFSLQIERVIASEQTSVYNETKKKDPWKILKNIARKHFQENVEITINEEPMSVRLPDGTIEQL